MSLEIINGRDPETGLQRVWSSTTLGELKSCARKFQYSILEGWRTKHQSFALRFGLEYQYALEQHDRLLASGVSYDDAIRSVVRTTLERTWERPVPTEDSEGKAPEGTPWGPGPDDREPNRNRETLIRSIVWKLEHYRTDPAHTIILADGKPAVELSFQMEAPFGPEIISAPNYIFSGHLDRVVEFAGETFVEDNKHTTKTLGSQYFRQYDLDNQMSLYSLGARVVFSSPVKGVLITAAQVAVGFTRFERAATFRTEGQVDEWIHDAQYWIGQAERFTVQKYWPQNDRSCFLCQFKGICSKDPAVRQMFLESDFVRQLHDPLEIRG